MSTIRNSLKKGYHAALRLARLMGGQKEHRSSGRTIPLGGFVSEEAVFVFPNNVRLGEDVMILSSARLICAGMPPYLESAGTIDIGAESVIREGAILQTYGGKITIGKNCTINPYSLIQGNGGIEIGDNTLIASHVCMYSANHRFSDLTRPIRAQGETREGICVGRDVWIGGGAIILDGVSIGDGAVIAAGAVVNRDIAAGTIVAGVPGRLLGNRKGI